MVDNIQKKDYCGLVLHVQILWRVDHVLLHCLVAKNWWVSVFSLIGVRWWCQNVLKRCLLDGKGGNTVPLCLKWIIGCERRGMLGLQTNFTIKTFTTWCGTIRLVFSKVESNFTKKNLQHDWKWDKFNFWENQSYCATSCCKSFYCKICL